MKTKLLQMTSIVAFIWSLILINGCKTNNSNNDYLRKVLSNLEKIKSATYSSMVSASAPEDTLSFKTYHRLTEEYINPADTFFGSSFVEIQYDDDNKVNRMVYDNDSGNLTPISGYGKSRVSIGAADVSEQFIKKLKIMRSQGIEREEISFNT